MFWLAGEVMPGDRVSELYNGKIFQPHAQEACRDRINWMCAQVRGKRVLDLGCSQGIASILLGRERFEVVGLDIDPEAIAYARADLAAEPDFVQRAVRFELIEPGRLPADDAAFDTVLLGEVLEHLLHPDQLVAEAQRVLKPGGTLIVTTPFGLFPHADHKRTYYLSAVVAALAPRFAIGEVLVLHKWICCIASPLSPGRAPATFAAERLLAIAESAFERIEHHQTAERQSLRKSLENATERHRRRSLIAERRIQELRARERARSAAWAAEREKMAQEREAARSQRETARQQRERLTAVEESLVIAEDSLKSQKNLHDRLRAERDKLKADLLKTRQRVYKLQQDRETFEKKLDAVRRENADVKRRYRIKCEQARQAVESIRWQAGDALAKALTSPVEALRLPLRLARLMSQARRKQARRVEQPGAIVQASTGTVPQLPPPDTHISGAMNGNGTLLATSTETSCAGAGALEAPLIHISSNGDTHGFEDGHEQRPNLLRVACILDEFSHECFAPEAQFAQLSPDDWRRELDALQPAFLFVESAWRGRDELWRHMIAPTPGKERGPLKQIVQHCRKRGIPTVFWNKEDPANFEHFKESAALFDVIFTTDSNCIDNYRKLSGHDRCFALPFAAQARLHNPIGRRGGELGNVCFAGTWYAQKHDGRRQDAELILEPALEFGLHIYDRQHAFTGPGWQNYQWPPQYESAIRGGLSYPEMVEAYKKYHVFMNVNSVRNSPTMCARRVFEILACGTNVVSSYAPAIENLLPGCASLSRTAAETRAHLKALLGDASLRNRTSVHAIRTIFGQHTYSHRFATIRQAIGLGGEFVPPLVTVIARVRNREDAARAREFIDAQTYGRLEIIWLAPSGTVDRAANENVIAVDSDSEVAAAAAQAVSVAHGELAFAWSRETPSQTTLIEDLSHTFSYFDGDAAGKPDHAPDQLIFRPVTRLPLAGTMLRMATVKRWGADVLVDQGAFEQVAIEGRLLATHTVGGSDRLAAYGAAMPALARAASE